MTKNVNWREMLLLFSAMVEKQIDTWYSTCQEDSVEDFVQRFATVTGASVAEVREALRLDELRTPEEV